MLEIYAGENALKTIQDQGLQQELFTSLYGASGGTKWFTLFGLDKYLFAEFFSERRTPFNIMGSSAGAFRAACFAQKSPVEAITRLAESYSQTVYSKNAKSDEVTKKANDIVNFTLGDNGVNEVLTNPIFQVNLLANKVKGFVASEQKLIQSLGLIKSILLNKVSRTLLTSQYQRVVFQTPQSKLSIDDYCNFTTHYVTLTDRNFKDALLASGSIPLVMHGVSDIIDAPRGIYRDGGIIDYHFDIDLKLRDGLTLYPHFNASPKAGWFDKNLNRKVKSRHYDNVVMLVPSQQFIESLPFNKIPDRTDFTTMDSATRINYWTSVLNATDALADSFHELITTQDLARIKLFNAS